MRIEIHNLNGLDKPSVADFYEGRKKLGTMEVNNSELQDAESLAVKLNAFAATLMS